MAFATSNVTKPSSRSLAAAIEGVWLKRGDFKQPPRRRSRLALFASANSPDGEVAPQSPVETALILGSVPAMWGSYGIAVKLIFANASYVPDTVVNLTTYFLAYASLVAVRRVASDRRASLKEQESCLGDSAIHEPRRRAQRGVLMAAGAELGTYLFLGSFLQLLALEHTSASRSAVLVQLTTVFIPVAAVVFGQERANVRTFAAAVAAFIGCIILSVDGQDMARFTVNTGDALSVLSAVMYTVHVLRLQRVLPRISDSTALVQAKAAAQVLLGILTCAIVLRSSDISAIRSGLASAQASSASVALLASVWIGVTGAAGTVAQVVSQRRVGPSLSAIVFSLQPVFAIIFALIFLQERIDTNEAIGSALVVLAGLSIVI